MQFCLHATLASVSCFPETILTRMQHFGLLQLLLKSKTRYFSRGTIIADSREDAKGLVVITAGQVELLPHFINYEMLCFFEQVLFLWIFFCAMFL
jgi:hypothetical protein